MKNLLAATAILSLLQMPPVLAGVESSGGADAYVVTPSWYYSADPQARIRACYDVAPGFGVAPDRLEADAQAAMAEWGRYLVDKNRQTPTLQTLGGNYFITAMDLKAGCTGSEDLRFHFGTKPAEVAGALGKYDHPLAFAQETHPASGEGFASGFIYVARPGEAPLADWSLETRLQAVLLHEVGHTLGNGHVPATIMDADLGGLLFPHLNRPDIVHIDLERELLTCTECPRTIPGMLAYINLESHNAAATFAYLTGHAADQLSAVRYVAKDLIASSEINDQHGPEGDLIYTDRSGEHRFHVKALTTITSSYVEVPVFRFQKGALAGWSASMERTDLGTLTREDGRPLSIAIGINTAGGAISIKSLEADPSMGDGELRVLFVGQSPFTPMP